MGDKVEKEGKKHKSNYIWIRSRENINCKLSKERGRGEHFMMLSTKLNNSGKAHRIKENIALCVTLGTVSFKS